MKIVIVFFLIALNLNSSALNNADPLGQEKRPNGSYPVDHRKSIKELRPFEFNRLIKRVQYILSLKGMHNQSINGKLDAYTTESIHKFQKKNNLPLNPLLNEITLNYLGVSIYD